MPMVVGDSTAATGWAPLTDLRVGGTPVQQAVLGTPDGPVPLWRRGPWLTTLTASTTVTAPSWALYADIIAKGAGGGGAGGNGGNTLAGNGGYTGKWASTVWAMIPGRVLTVTIGAGGAGGKANDNGPGSAGGATSITVSDRDWKVTAAGGAGGSGTGGRSGETGGSYTLTGYGTDLVATGGVAAGTDIDGKLPGGGGGPGSGGIFNGAKAGRSGGAGTVWIRFRSY